SDVVIETDSNFKTTITCEKAKFNIVGKSGDDFPIFHLLKEMNVFQSPSLL
ncbi:hypothetical protein LEA_01897, partial [human gut metagenome]